MPQTIYPSSPSYPPQQPGQTAQTPAGADQAQQQPQQTAVQFLTLGHKIAPYLTYTIDTYYIWNNGVLQLPLAVANPTPSVQTPANTGYTYTQADLQIPQPEGYVQTQPPIAFAQRASSSIVNTSAPYGKKIVVIRAKRTNILPVLPDPTPSNPNQALLYTVIHPQTPIVMPDMQSRVFCVYAEYVYVLLKPLWVADGYMQLPTSPVDGLPRSTYQVQNISFVKGLI